MIDLHIVILVNLLLESQATWTLWAIFTLAPMTLVQGVPRVSQKRLLRGAEITPGPPSIQLLPSLGPNSLGYWELRFLDGV